MNHVGIVVLVILAIFFAIWGHYVSGEGASGKHSIVTRVVVILLFVALAIWVFWGLTHVYH